MSPARVFYLVPNITSEHRSRDYWFRKYCYSAYQNGRQPNDLTFDGYFRAICIYGGEESLNTNLKSGKKVYQTLLQYPALARRLRDLAITKGYLRPQENTFSTTIFWDQATFSQTTDEEEARKIFRRNAQPPIARRNVSFTEQWPQCPNRWIPAPIPGSDLPRDFSTNDTDIDDSSDIESHTSEDFAYSDDDTTIMPGSQPRNLRGQFVPTPNTRKTGNPATPASRGNRKSSTMSATKERAMANQANEGLEFVKVTHGLTTDLVQGDMKPKEFSEAMTTTFTKYPNVYARLKEAHSALIPNIAMSGSEIALRMIDDAVEDTRLTTTSKRRVIDISDDEEPVETPTKIRRTLFKDDLVARNSFSNARSSTSNTPTPAQHHGFAAASKEKIARLTSDRTYFKYVSEQLFATMPDVGPLEVVNWSPGLHALIYEGEGVIDVPRVIAVIRAIIALLITDEEPMSRMPLNQILYMLKISVNTARFRKTDAEARKGYTTAHETALVDAAKGRSSEDLCLTAGAAYMYGQKFGLSQLFALDLDKLINFINKEEISLAHVGALLGLDDIEGIDDAGEVVSTPNMCLG